MSIIEVCALGTLVIGAFTLGYNMGKDIEKRRNSRSRDLGNH